jgi:hypothetical protein
MCDKIKEIVHLGTLLATKCSARSFPKGVNFITDPSQTLQVGVLNHDANHIILPHQHKAQQRSFERTREVLIILEGRLKAEFYWNKEKVSSLICGAGDILTLYDGGHGFEIIEDATIIEAKLGPYLQDDDKERF